MNGEGGEQQQQVPNYSTSSVPSNGRHLAAAATARAMRRRIISSNNDYDRVVRNLTVTGTGEHAIGNGISRNNYGSTSTARNLHLILENIIGSSSTAAAPPPPPPVAAASLGNTTISSISSNNNNMNERLIRLKRTMSQREFLDWEGSSSGHSRHGASPPPQPPPPPPPPPVINDNNNTPPPPPSMPMGGGSFVFRPRPFNPTEYMVTHLRMMIRQQRQAIPGISEEEIMRHIGLEVIDIGGEVTPDNVEVCTICLDEFVNGAIAGKLDCDHRFHLECIKQWLLINNSCPLCKRRGLLLSWFDDKVVFNHT